MSEQWIGSPEVDLTENSLAIEQHVQIGNIRARDAITVTTFEDGSVRITSRGEDSIELPAHWLPIVNEFLARAEVSA